jgi:hypothetical protein
MRQSRVSLDLATGVFTFVDMPGEREECPASVVDGLRTMLYPTGLGRSAAAQLLSERLIQAHEDAAAEHLARASEVRGALLKAADALATPSEGDPR